MLFYAPFVNYLRGLDATNSKDFGLEAGAGKMEPLLAEKYQ